ncbi:hypothetical protein ADENT20671_1371 [Actinomyces denticolens]|nr:hypothetical protein ADENT20671_1371 [Actinomyces denticolens]
MGPPGGVGGGALGLARSALEGGAGRFLIDVRGLRLEGGEHLGGVRGRCEGRARLSGGGCVGELGVLPRLPGLLPGGLGCRDPGAGASPRGASSGRSCQSPVEDSAPVAPLTGAPPIMAGGDPASL